jgi:tetratricopeptide (TPR) repeat protein
VQQPDEEPQICWSCEKNEASEPFPYAGHLTLVCARCLPRLKARDELDRVLQQSIELVERGQVDAVLASLDAFLEANRDYDYDRRFARQVAESRAVLLFDAGRYAEAEQACQAWAQLGFTRVLDRWAHGFETARTLDALGRPREALAILENALSYRDQYLFSAAEMLVTLVELSKKLGQPIDPKWRSLAEAVAEAYGVEMPVDESLEKTCLALAEMTREILPKRARD